MQMKCDFCRKDFEDYASRHPEVHKFCSQRCSGRFGKTVQMSDDAEGLKAHKAAWKNNWKTNMNKNNSIYRLPLAGGKQATLTTPAPLSRRDIDWMIQFLKLLQEDTPEASKEETIAKSE